MKFAMSMFTLAALSSSAYADTQPSKAGAPTSEITIALYDPKQEAAVFEASVQIADPSGCSIVKSSDRQSAHELTICRRGDERALQIDLTRVLRGDVDERRQVTMSVAISPGKRHRIGRITSGGGTLEIMASRAPTAG